MFADPVEILYGSLIHFEDQQIRVVFTVSVKGIVTGVKIVHHMERRSSVCMEGKEKIRASWGCFTSAVAVVLSSLEAGAVGVPAVCA